jgi:hypothetical protein
MGKIPHKPPRCPVDAAHGSNRLEPRPKPTQRDSGHATRPAVVALEAETGDFAGWSIFDASRSMCKVLHLRKPIPVIFVLLELPLKLF